VIGNLSLDSVDGEPPRPGGTVLYSARALAALGVEVRVGASCAAADKAGLLSPFEALGLPVRWYESEITTAYAFHYEGDRRVMQQRAVGDPWPPERALEAVGDADWVHVGALVRTDFPEETLAVLVEGGHALLVDAQGLVRTPALGALRIDDQIGDVLRHVSILKLDEEEARTLVRSAKPERLLSLNVSEVILTLGSRGAYIVTPHAIEQVPADEVPGVRDPTGAGDTFSAAYVAARARGEMPVAAAFMATSSVAAFLAGR
jgi:sugar/nucleoside kinase (ribokinase family)